MAALACPAAALAADGPSGGAAPGGATTPTSPTASPRSAPAGGPARPAGTAVMCRSKCTGIGVRPGGLVRISGTNLRSVVQVVFLGGPGAGDNRAVKARHVKADRLDFRVSSTAPSGRLRLITKSAVLSRADPRISLVVDTGSSDAEGPLPPLNMPGLTAQVQTRRVYFGAATPASLSFVLRTATPQDVRVDVVSVAGGVSVINRVLYAVAPGTPQVVTWNGLAATGAVPPDGRYQFRIAVGPQPPPGAVPAAARAASAPPATAADAGAFLFLGAKFPVRGRHNYGSGSDRFGAGRAGHVHQGQDILAACGTPLVAARGGTVLWRARQSLAGNYLVIKTDGSGGVSHAYMHLREPALVEKGQHVATGQLIGYVGDTGDATACHLHFELWTAPGWYLGGHAIDPLSSLLAWDATS